MLFATINAHLGKQLRNGTDLSGTSFSSLMSNDSFGPTPLRGTA